MEDKLYSLKEASEILNCSVQTLKRAVKNKKLSAEKKNVDDRQSYYLNKESIREYAEKKNIKIDESFFKKESRVKISEEKITENKKDDTIELKKDIKPLDYKKCEQQLQSDYEKLVEQNKTLIYQLEEVMSELETVKIKEAETLSNQNLLVTEKENLETFLKEVEESMLQMTEQYKELAEQTMERDRKLEHLKSILNIKDEEIEHIRRELEELSLTHKELNELRLKYEGQSIEFENMRAENESMRNQLSEVENVILQMTEQYKSLANQTYDRDRKIESLTKDLEEKKRCLNLKEKALKVEKNRDWWDKILGN